MDGVNRGLGILFFLTFSFWMMIIYKLKKKKSIDFFSVLFLFLLFEWNWQLEKKGATNSNIVIIVYRFNVNATIRHFHRNYQWMYSILNFVFSAIIKWDKHFKFSHRWITFITIYLYILYLCSFYCSNHFSYSFFETYRNGRYRSKFFFCFFFVLFCFPHSNTIQLSL